MTPVAGQPEKDSPTEPLRPLRHNITALGVVQLASYVFPLLIAAYTTRVLGAEAWGRVVVVQAVLAYFASLASWGFTWSATRKIAAVRHDRAAVARIASATFAAQLLLALAAAAMIAGLVATTPYFGRDARFYAYGTMALLAAALYPAWLFQGLEWMKEDAAVQVASKATVLGLVLLLVHQPLDAPLVLGATAAGSLLAFGLAAASLRRLQLPWRPPSLAAIRQELRDGAQIFVSTLAVGLYVNIVPILLGSVAGSAAAGHFALADRVRAAAQGLLSPVSNALFPRMSHLASQGADPVRHLLRRAALGILAASAAISVVLFGGAEVFMRLLGGPEFLPAAQILRWLALLPLVMSFSTFLGLQVLLPQQETRAFNAILLGAAALSLVIVWPLVRHAGSHGAAWTMLATETFVAIAMTAYALRSGLAQRLMGIGPSK